MTFRDNPIDLARPRLFEELNCHWPLNGVWLREQYDAGREWTFEARDLERRIIDSLEVAILWYELPQISRGEIEIVLGEWLESIDLEAERQIHFTVDSSIEIP